MHKDTTLLPLCPKDNYNFIQLCPLVTGNDHLRLILNCLYRPFEIKVYFALQLNIHCTPNLSLMAP